MFDLLVEVYIFRILNISSLKYITFSERLLFLEMNEERNNLFFLSYFIKLSYARREAPRIFSYKARKYSEANLR